jgi:Mrp family chromosome partitioning ATPase
MVDLTSEMAGLLAALGPAPSYRGRVIQFVSAAAGEGVSTVSREFARLAAVRARKPVWLVDADLDQQGQQEAIAGQEARFGRLGQAATASPDGQVFYAVSPQLLARDGSAISPSRLLTARPCLGTRLWVTRFRMESLRSGQRAEVLPDAHYWDAMRKHADTVVVDSPSADRSDVAITLAPYVDATIIVVAAESTAANEPVILRDEIEAVGGRIAGVVVNRSRYKAPGFLRRLTG